MADLLANLKHIDQVRSIISFKFLTDGQILDLLSVSELVSYAEGEVILEENDTGNHFYGIMEGTVSISVREAEGRSVYVNSLGPGDVFGEAGIFMNVKRTATVTSTGSVHIIRIARKDLVQFIKKYPESGNKILLVIIYSLLRKLRMVNQELAYERRCDACQDDIDSMVESLFAD
ncbi:MAG: cyclic nucleotide-binding domain-containing protein [Spirochaetes bacterium]|nr:cyclic nucleotide-binding domain-containing protein [Spirochaetota bacterium]MBU0956199.1 cyclic nucleotide-binding domain-containing protein [Spirochaetota bacterium]